MARDASTARALYDTHIAKYARNQAKDTVINALRKRILTEIGPVKNKKMLFAGCGDGQECAPYVKKGAEVYGVDISPNAIGMAKACCPSGNFSVGDIEHLPYTKGRFDIVIAINSLMYKKELRPGLKELLRVLNPKGMLILVVPHPLRKMMKYQKGNYFVKGKRFETWKGTRRFNYYRLFEDYLNAFASLPLRISKTIEPRPPKNSLQKEQQYPHHLVFFIRKDS